MQPTGVAVCDLDGVIWLGPEPVAGVGEAIAELRAGGVEVLFMTNNSSLTGREIQSRLGDAGIGAEAADILSSATATAHLLGERLDAGAPVLACAAQGVVEALETEGLCAVGAGPCDAVVVGWHRDFDFERMARAADGVRSGALFVATNLDATYPTADGLLPGNGALVAAVAAAAGRPPDVVAGKPEAPTVQLVQRWAGERTGVVIGDRPSTDGCLAAALGWPFVLISSDVGATESTFESAPTPVITADSLRAAVDAILGVLRPSS